MKIFTHYQTYLSRTSLIKVLLVVVSCVIGVSSATSVYALNPSDYPGQNVLFYSENTAACTDPPSSALSGNTNLEKIYLYMMGKGLKDYQAAGVVGNISVESGGNPINAQKGADTKDPSGITGPIGGGNAWGIIQWDPGNRAIGYAAQAKIKGAIYELSTQLDIVWWHMTVETPTGKTTIETPTGKMKFIDAYKQTTDVVDATNLFERGMEGAGHPSMTDRIKAAQLALKQYGSGITDPVADPTLTTDLVPATSTSCLPGGGSTNGASVVSIAQAELAKNVKEWDSNALKYTDNGRFAWCASFVSWVYKESGQTITKGSAGGWLHASVLEMRSWFKANGVYFDAGTQTPQPGDIAFYVQSEAKSGQNLGAGPSAEHVNIVETVSSDGSSMTAIGGNQDSQVTRWKVNIKAGQYALVGFGRMK